MRADFYIAQLQSYGRSSGAILLKKRKVSALARREPFICPMITPPVSAPVSRLRSIVSGSIGNLVEWYDWYAYSAFALYFAPVFFPHGSATAQLLNTAAIFAVAF